MVTHGPPKHHLDGPQAPKIGCECLRQALWNVRPALHVFGHVHQGRGVELVKWDIRSRHIQHKELSTTRILDSAPEGKKLFKVDLTQIAEREETCLVNAAIVMRPWRKGIGHAGRNKAIVVDLMIDVADLRGGPRDEIVEGSRPIAGGGFARAWTNTGSQAVENVHMVS